MKWRSFASATTQRTSLGLLTWFLEREGTTDTFEGWRYLHEGRLAVQDHVFKGPPIKMILAAKYMADFVATRPKRD